MRLRRSFAARSVTISRSIIQSDRIRVWIIWHRIRCTDHHSELQRSLSSQGGNRHPKELKEPMRKPPPWGFGFLPKLLFPLPDPLSFSIFHQFPFSRCFFLSCGWEVGTTITIWHIRTKYMFLWTQIATFDIITWWKRGSRTIVLRLIFMMRTT